MKVFFVANGQPLENLEFVRFHKRNCCPGGGDTWKGITFVENYREADFLIVYNAPNYVPRDFPHEKIVYIKTEPDGFEFTDHYWDYVDKQYSHFFTMDENRHRRAGWSIDKPYDELTKDFPEKTKKISWITSNTGDGTQPSNIQILNGHYLRMIFLKKFIDKYPNELDLYGKGLEKYQFQGNKGPIDHKWDALKDYRYAFVFENCWQPGYYSEKLCDAVLDGCMPIYWGCPTLEKFLPKDSFIRLDLVREDAHDLALEIINSDFRENHLDELKEAKRLMLNEYSIFPTVKKDLDIVLKKNKKSKLEVTIT